MKTRGRYCRNCNRMFVHKLDKVKIGEQWFYRMVCKNCGNELKKKCDNPHKRGE